MAVESKHNEPMQQARTQVRAANLPVVDEATASPEVRYLYRQYRAHFKRDTIPGIVQCFATHTPLLKQMLGLAQDMLFVEGQLGRPNKELLSTFVSSLNNCAYCADSHACGFLAQGGDLEAVGAALACDLESSHLSHQQRALLRFAQQVTDASSRISPEDVNTMRGAGFSNAQIAETIHITALFATFNRVANAFGLPSQHLLDAFQEAETPHGR